MFRIHIAYLFVINLLLLNSPVTAIELSKEPLTDISTDKIDTADFIYPNHQNNNCLFCHKGIEPIRDPNSGMMQEIYALVEEAGFQDNECIACHGGNPISKNICIALFFFLTIYQCQWNC